MIKVTLGNGEIKEFDAPLSAFDAARELGEAKTACAAEIDGKVCDLRTTLTDGCTVKFLTFEDEQGQRAFNHTASHVLAQAVKRLFPATKLAIGPAIENGFYYDFDTEEPFTTDTLAKIEAEMKKIVKESIRLEHFTMAPDEAIKYLEEQGEPYKVELCQEHAGKGEPISFYKQGDFTDLCAGPHLMSTSPVKAFKLTSVTGAYWRGSEKNKMLTRIYGTAFPSKDALNAHLEALEDAKRRDHNKIGRELEYFTTVDYIGQGLPILLPKGAKVVQIMQRWVEDVEAKHGCQLTKTPYMAKRELYKISGHWDHYLDGMFVLGDPNDETKECFALRPMTCPFQYQVFLNRQRSYRDLPMRLTETSTLFRNEDSGEMHGLIRVRQFTISEGTPEQWEIAQATMKTILDDLGVQYTIGIDEAAFYGPKLDIQYKNVFGKEDTLVTIQIDMLLAQRFGMEYVDVDGTKKNPYIIHRTSLGCYERTLAYLLEKYAGALPLWLSPEQVRILPITDRAKEYAESIAKRFDDMNIRVTVDNRNEKIGYKIRQAQLEKIPYFFILGDKEVEDNTVALRSRKDGDLGASPVEDVIAKILKENAEKTR